MSAPTCAICGRPVPDQALVCETEARRAGAQLAAIAELAPDARAVAAGLVRRGSGSAGGKPGSRPPLNDGATDALSEIANTLTTLARDIAEIRGIEIPGYTRRRA